MDPVAIQETAQLCKHICLLGLVIGAMYTDMTTRTVPNALTYTAAMVGVVLNLLEAPSWVQGLTFAGQGFALGFLLFLLLHAMGVLNSADVKLMGAIGALSGWRFTANTILFTTLIGGVIGTLQLLYVGARRMADEGSEAGAARAAAAAGASGSGPMEQRDDGVPVHVVDASEASAEGDTSADASPDASADASPDEGADESASVSEKPAHDPNAKVTYTPYGLCIALGTFAAYRYVPYTINQLVALPAPTPN